MSKNSLVCKKCRCIGLLWELQAPIDGPLVKRERGMHRELLHSPYFQLNSPYNCSANRSVVDSYHSIWSNCKHTMVFGLYIGGSLDVK